MASGGRGGGAGGGRRPRQDILDLSVHVGKEVTVKFTGGREVRGVLRGYDSLVNLVLDACSEALRDPSDPHRLTGERRDLGMCVCRGSQVMLICPCEGFEQIENPWASGGKHDQQEPVV